jgi:hypothetical protein
LFSSEFQGQAAGVADMKFAKLEWRPGLLEPLDNPGMGMILWGDIGAGSLRELGLDTAIDGRLYRGASRTCAGRFVGIGPAKSCALSMERFLGRPNSRPVPAGAQRRARRTSSPRGRARRAATLSAGSSRRRSGQNWPLSLMPTGE